MEGELANFREFVGPLNGFVGSHEVAADLKSNGFDMVNRAQNHLLDSELEGMFSTNRLLDAAGIAHAGTGKNLEEAAAPVYLELLQGRVAMIGLHAPISIEDTRLAATTRAGNLGGRAGLNMLNYTETVVLSAGQLDKLRQVRDELQTYSNNYDNPRPVPPNGQTESVRFPTSSFNPFRPTDPNYRVARAGEIPGTIDYTMNPADLARILRSVRNAKQYADFVIASAHIHQGQSVLETRHLSTRPPHFYRDLAHQAIDVGADAFVGHGVQLLRGVEIYKGKPIFYGLGEFIREPQWTLGAMMGTVDVNPMTTVQAFAREFGGSSQYLESMVAVSHYTDGKLTEIRLYPVELGADRLDSKLGIPRMAPTDLGRKILERVQMLSQELGTTIEIVGTVGVIRL